MDRTKTEIDARATFAHQREMHFEKLEKAFWNNLFHQDGGYSGSIGLDDKRPFGNQDMESDVLEIIGWSMEGDDGEEECWASWQRKYARDLYDKLADWLKKKYGEK